MGLLKKIVKAGARIGLKAEKEAKRVVKSKKVRKAAKKVVTISIKEGKKLEAELRRKLNELERETKKTKKATTKRKKK